ncbi:MAG: hypothetical protein ISR65_03215 [Bacteriovoracaceae bacterium]|nr:hypothetical protein [Bacteriovoracaceae bacterium]
MKNKVSRLKNKLDENWEAIKDRFPIVIDAELVDKDSVQQDVLKYFDGLKSADEIREYLSLDKSDAHLIFVDLLRSGAVRFLEDIERPKYIKNRNIELKNNLEFLKSEKTRLIGEELYLKEQIVDKERELEAYKAKVPENEKVLGDLNQKLEKLKIEPDKLWKENADLFALKNEMFGKEKKIRTVLRELETGLPRLIKRKVRLDNLIKQSESGIDVKNVERDNSLSELFTYRDTIDEIKSDLFATKARLRELADE